jgi:RimJ/RimL family protein N-acetyltransferase
LVKAFMPILFALRSVTPQHDMMRLMHRPPFPSTVNTERLTLRLPNDEGARQELEMILESLDHLWPWFSFRAVPPKLAERIDLAARHRAEALAGKSASYLVFADDRPVGKVWLNATTDTTVTLGWWLRVSATGQGYATEAVRALVDLALKCGFARIEVHTDPDNARSRALAERAGFVLEEIRPDFHDRPDGARRPECIYVYGSPADRQED